MNMLPYSKTLPEERHRLSKVQQISKKFRMSDRADVYLFANTENSLSIAKIKGCNGTQLTKSPASCLSTSDNVIDDTAVHKKPTPFGVNEPLFFLLLTFLISLFSLYPSDWTCCTGYSAHCGTADQTPRKYVSGFWEQHLAYILTFIKLSDTDKFLWVYIISIHLLSCTINHNLVFCSISKMSCFLGFAIILYVDALDRLLVSCWECVHHSNLFLKVWNSFDKHSTVETEHEAVCAAWHMKQYSMQI